MGLPGVGGDIIIFCKGGSWSHPGEGGVGDCQGRCGANYVR